MIPVDNRTINFDEDDSIPWVIYDGEGLTDEEFQAQLDAGTAQPKDITDWTIAFSMRKRVNSADPPLIYKTTADDVSIENTFGGSPEQQVVVTFHDTDTYDPDGSPAVLIKGGDYVYALKRIDDGFEKNLVEGRMTVHRTAAWE